MKRYRYISMTVASLLYRLCVCANLSKAQKKNNLSSNYLDK